ncbi:hypothetical protein [Promicromonospora sp. NPDC060271]|uniref:hypothetical protein n=1 Tax=Promicromonospora sp. NPDC060271 TaxID=3347089 RepID=UPI00364FF421
MNAAPRRRPGARSLSAWSRQHRFPAEFRIPSPALAPDPAADPARVPGPDLAPEPAPASGPASSPAAAPAPDPLPDPRPGVLPGDLPGDLPDDVLAGLVTELWRARNKVDGPAAEQDPPRAVRWANRYLAAADDRLVRAGIEVEGHDGLRFDVGMDLRVLAYQDDPDVTEETVVETIRPSVRRAGRVIQEGEVIVAVPERSGAKRSGAERAAAEKRGTDDA